MQHPDEGTIHAWLDGALSADEGARIEAHLAECPACSAAVAEARGLIAGASRILAALDEVPGGVIPEPAGVGAPPMAQRAPPARTTRVTDIATRRGRFLRAPYLSAAAGILLVAVTTLVLERGRGTPHEQTSIVQAVSGKAEPGNARDAAARPGAVAATSPSSLPRPQAATSPRQDVSTQLSAPARVAARAPSAEREEPARRFAKAAAADTSVVPVIRPSQSVARSEQAKVADSLGAAEAAGATVGSARAVPSVPPSAAMSEQRRAAGAVASRPDSARTGTLAGVVREQSTGAPIAGAVVSLLGQSLGAVTDDAGRYTIRDVPAGEHTVAVRSLGYKPDQREVEVRADSVRELDVRLTSTPARLEEVAVTAQTRTRTKPGSPAPIARAPAESALGQRGPGRANAALAPAASPSLAGCYELALGRWQPAVALEADSLALRPPRRIALEATAFDDRALAQRRDVLRAYQVRPAPGSPPSAHEAAYWIPIGADSVEIVWESGFSGLTMRLHADGGTLRGRAETFSDAGRQRQTTDVTARRIACEGPR